jgi:methylenetetrahydrofolate reductase (NADPH)
MVTVNNDFHENRVIYELLDGLAVEGLTNSPIPASVTPATNGNHTEPVANGNGHSNGVDQAVATA